MGDVKNGYQATPNATLEQQMMDACAPKNEREWWAFAEIGRLRAEVEAPRARRGQVMDITEQLTHESRIALAAVAEIIRLRAEVEALRADAERYRWLRNAAGRGAAGSIFDNFNGSAVDECIDAARAAQGDKA